MRLNLSVLNLKGQIVPGLSVVCSYEKKKIRLPIMTFPGNLGDVGMLEIAWRLMETCRNSKDFHRMSD